MILEEDRLILHDLKGVNLKVDFFLGTRKEFIEHKKCIAYSVCYDSVDVRVYQLTIMEPLSDLDFYFNTQQLVIDEHIISGEVISFSCTPGDTGLTACCTILLGRDY